MRSFNSRTPGGVRHQPPDGDQDGAHGFNSRTPGGVRPVDDLKDLKVTEFQFTHPGRGATRKDGAPVTEFNGFNSRTPGGVRHHHRRSSPPPQGVSIHAPREGCDNVVYVDCSQVKTFQFTHPGRGATSTEWKQGDKFQEFQFTHPGRGATIPQSGYPHPSAVSIHAPREGCDYKPIGKIEELSAFQFTHPGRGATQCCTHRRRRIRCFNSRTPGGVRRYR